MNKKVAVKGARNWFSFCEKNFVEETNDTEEKFTRNWINQSEKEVTLFEVNETFLFPKKYNSIFCEIANIYLTPFNIVIM